MADKLTGMVRQEALAGLSGWRECEERNAIQKKFHFENFNQALGFMIRVSTLWRIPHFAHFMRFSIPEPHIENL